ncbi:autophagy-related protein 2 homolog B isoform X1 [Hydra vulgaris]|nr:autophagy-related protein 2 homolog B isoform X1 [Hydra vulgaris]
MPWYFPWSESIKKRACRYLLQHYLGDFLKEKLDLDQLTVDLYNGKGTVTNILLDVWALNEMLSNAGVALELVDGFISSISVSVPWKALLNDSCELEIHGLNLTFVQKQKMTRGNLFDSTYSWSSMSMTTSIQLAQECLRQESNANSNVDTGQFEGLEAFAQTIESVLARVRLTFIDTKIRFENVPVDASTGIGIELNIDRIDYWDLSHEEVAQDTSRQHSVYEPVAVAIKSFQIAGLVMIMDEFPKHCRTRLREALTEEEKIQQESFLRGGSNSNPDLLPRVRFLSSCGKQTVKMKFKQNDALPGPKVDIEYSLAALNVFLSPRQLHLLVNALSRMPETLDTSRSDLYQDHNTRRNKMRTMKSADYLKVEESLQHQVGSMDFSLKNKVEQFKPSINLSSLSHNSTLSEEEFFSMTEYPLPALGQPSLIDPLKQSPFYNRFDSTSSRLSNVSLGGFSSSSKGTLTEQASSLFRATSGSSSSPSPKCSGFHSSSNVGLAGISLLDDSVDVTHIKLRSNNIIFILLHQDPLTYPQHGGSNSLTEMVDKFFSQVQQYSMQSLFGLNAEQIRESLLTICCSDHLRFLASAVYSDSEYKTVIGSTSSSTNIVIGKIAVDENLYGNDNKNNRFVKPYSQSKILHFKYQEDSPLYSGPPLYSGSLLGNQSPCFKLKINSVVKANTLGVQSRNSFPPKFSIEVDASELNIEIDLSMRDRIISLISPAPLYKMNNASHDNAPFMYASLATGHSANQQTAFRQAMDDSPVITDKKTDITIRCPFLTAVIRIPIPDLQSNNDIDKRTWWRKTVHKESLQVQIYKAEFKTSISSMLSTLSYELFFKSCKGLFDSGEDLYHLFDIDCNSEEGETGSMTVDVPRILVNLSSSVLQSVFEETEQGSKSSSPDSFEDHYPWMKSEPSPFSSQPNMYENIEMVTPASKKEMNAFQEFATKNSKFTVNCYFPLLSANLHNHEIFELIYNRLFGDLIMWQPLAPTQEEFYSKMGNPYEGVHINLASHIGQLNTGGDKFFMCRSAIRDIYDSNSIDASFISAEYNDSPLQSLKCHQQTNLCFSIHIDSGKIAFFPPLKSDVDSSLIGYGHTVLNIQDGHLFLASGYKGQPNMDYMQIYADGINLYHNPTVCSTLDTSVIEDAVATSGLTLVMNPSESHVRAKCKEQSYEPMLLLALKCTTDTNLKKKENIVSLSFQSGTLNYCILPSSQSWFTQIMDFLDVRDFAIQGYNPPLVITLFHLNLKSCAVDYKPLYIPLQTLFIFESFSLSSNVVPGSTASLLRFVMEDTSFYICNKGIDSETNEYVLLMDMGTFELSLKLTKGTDKRLPIVDLAMSNNMLNIRTCSDSCLELMKFIKYVASGGDLQKDDDVIKNNDCGPVEDLDMPSPSPSPSDTSQINSLLADAIRDATLADAMRDDTMIDAHKLKIDCLSEGTLLDTRIDESTDDDGDEPQNFDEYCFLENEAAFQTFDDHEPILNRLTEKVVLVTENFFKVPFGSFNLLGSPDDYPPPVYRYTVREMSIIWQMYGGSDFKVPSLKLSDKSKGGSAKSKETNQPDKSKTNRVKGGVGRDLDTLMEIQMNKVRFQHEIYPDDTQQIYRDVLVIYDLEIRDRLFSSQINKFLYRFSSESLPKQSSANMITVKFLVTKPEDNARSEEASLRVSLQPLRLNIDQDALFFLKNFFAEVSGSKPLKSGSEFSNHLSSPPRESFLSSLDSTVPVYSQNFLNNAEKSEKPALFIKSFIFSPEVPIRFDYHGKHVDIEQGTLAGIIIGLSQLNCSEIRLKRLCSRSGLLGPDKLINYMVTEWMNDIKQNQLGSILGGVGPTYSFLQLFQGIKDLFWMPVQQYRQDGRIVRGLQRGAHSFSTSTAMAVLELSNRLVSTIQSVAELTFDMVSPGPSHTSSLQLKNSSQMVQPAELREGMANAYMVLSEGLSQTASNLVRVATDEHDKKGMSGAVGGVLRQIPPTLVKPLILSAEATSNVLGGAMNQLAPDKHREALEKWRQDYY